MGEEGQEFPLLARMNLNRLDKVKKIVDLSICGVPHSGNQGPTNAQGQIAAVVRYLVYAVRCRSAFPNQPVGELMRREQTDRGIQFY